MAIFALRIFETLGIPPRRLSEHSSPVASLHLLLVTPRHCFDFALKLGAVVVLNSFRCRSWPKHYRLDQQSHCSVVPSHRAID
jgi:hypothetical protein